MNSLISSWCLNSLSKETGHSYDGQSRRRLIYKLIPRQASQASQKAFQAKMKHVHGHVSNWHLAKAMPAASLLCHTPGTQVHLTAPVPGQRAPSCSAPHEGNGMMTTSIIRSSCRVCKTNCHWRCYCRCWDLLHWRCLCFLLAKTSIGPQCGKRARMEQSCNSSGRGNVFDVCSLPYLFLPSFCSYCCLSLCIISLLNILLCALVNTDAVSNTYSV